MSQELVPLGKTPEINVGRDSVHIAIFPAVAECDLNPGEWVGVLEHATKGKETVVSNTAFPRVGVIDPFRDEPIKAGRRVYVCLTPNTISGLRHAWFSPLFPPEDADGAVAEERLKKKAILASIPGFKR